MATWSSIGQQYGLSARDIQAFQDKGYDPDSFTTAAGQGRSYQDIMSNPPTTAVQQQAAQATKPDLTGTQPEQRALQQMAAIDPATEALRQKLGASYLSNIGGGPAVPQPGALPQFKGQMSTAAPGAGDVQSYLDLYKKIDPQGYKQRVDLAGGESAYLKQMQAQNALGAQLDPGTVREVEQGTRRAQAARGNVYGTPQLVQETMQRGSAGEQRLQQRQQALQGALQNQQGYLQSGVGVGDVGNALYNQGYNRYLQGYQTQLGAQAQGYGQQLNAWQAAQNARLNAQQQGLSYLGSGQTPYQAGAAYYDRAQAMAQQAASGGAPQYQPSALGQNYSGQGTPWFGQYGLDVGAQANQWYNAMGNQQYNMSSLGQQGQAQNQQRNTAIGTGIGSAVGGVVGSFVPVVGTVAGAAAGGALGGVAGRMSA